MHQIIQPEGWAKPRGYANGVMAEGRHLAIAGQIGWNADKQFETDDFVGQTEQALKNIVAVVEAAGGTAANITRLTWYVTDKAEYLAAQKELGAAYVNALGRHFPAMTLVVVAGLLEDRAKVEIEAAAVL